MIRTTDTARILSVLNHPFVKPDIHEGDGDPLVPIHDAIYYLLPMEERYEDGSVEDVQLGVVAFLPINTITWNPHIAILPEHRGRGTEVMKAALAWMFANTPCRKIVAYPPAFKGAMIRVFEKCGFRFEGRSPRSFLWDGEVYDRLLMGIEKGLV